MRRIIYRSKIRLPEAAATQQPALPGVALDCCRHPLARHYEHTISESPPGDTWDVDICADCGCSINEQNRRPTAQEV